MTAEHTPQYEVTHCHHTDPKIAYVKRSPHKCVGYGGYTCVGVQDLIAMISLEPEMTEIIRRSNTHGELVAALEAVSKLMGGDTEDDDERWLETHKQVYAALQKARGSS